MKHERTRKNSTAQAHSLPKIESASKGMASALPWRSSSSCCHEQRLASPSSMKGKNFLRYDSAALQHLPTPPIPTVTYRDIISRYLENGFMLSVRTAPFKHRAGCTGPTLLREPRIG